MKKIRKDDYFELAVFLMDYHSGAGSRGYRLLSKLGPMRNFTDRFCMECQDSEIYQYLAEHYAERV